MREKLFHEPFYCNLQAFLCFVGSGREFRLHPLDQLGADRWDLVKLRRQLGNIRDLDHIRDRGRFDLLHTRGYLPGRFKLKTLAENA